MKRILSVIIIVVAVNLMQAQEKGTIEFGFNTGINVSSVSTSGEWADAGFGINIAGSADYYFSESWSLKAKVIYDQKGWNNGFVNAPIVDPEDYDPNVDGTLHESNVNLNYITIPLMANYHFAKKKNWYVNFGPYVGLLISAKETKFGVDYTEIFNRTDFGIAAGIGVKIPVSDKLKFFVEYEGNAGLNNINKYNNFKVRSSKDALNVGINFRFR